jgi:hypothetical protein
MNQRALPRPIFALSLLSFVVTGLACSSSGVGDSTPRALAGGQAVREDADEIPCEPRRVLQTVCQQCHSKPPRGGAPFPLVRRSDILATRTGVVVRELMIQQLDARRMPLTPVTIQDGERDVLLAWLRAGAPASAPQDCANDPTADGGDAGDAAPTDGATSDEPLTPDAEAEAEPDAAPDGSSELDAGTD